MARKQAGQPQPPPARPVGRPSDYSEELAARICDLISCGQSLNKITKTNDWAPDITTVFRWMYRHPEFRPKYEAACQERTRAWAEELVEIADDKTDDVMVVEHKGHPVALAIPNSVPRAKLMVDTRKWLLSKMEPKRYGDVKTPEGGGGGDEGKIQIVGGLPDDDDE